MSEGLLWLIFIVSSSGAVALTTACYMGRLSDERVEDLLAVDDLRSRVCVGGACAQNPIPQAQTLGARGLEPISH